MMSVTITGDKALDRKLALLGERGARRAVSSGVRASLKPMADALKAEVNGSTASARLKRAARQTIGTSMRKERGKGGAYSAKVGFGVGRQTKAKKRKAKARHLAGMQGERQGVGVSAANIHWFVLGTGLRRTSSDHRTGRLDQEFGGAVKAAFASAQSAMFTQAKVKIASVIEREAKRRT